VQEEEGSLGDYLEVDPAASLRLSRSFLNPETPSWLLEVLAGWHLCRALDIVTISNE
jgi:hypothetical protein